MSLERSRTQPKLNASHGNFCFLFQIARAHLFNPLSPSSDQHQISPNDINAYSTPEIMRIKDMINQGEYFNNFSLVLYKKNMGTRKENSFFEGLTRCLKPMEKETSEILVCDKRFFLCPRKMVFSRFSLLLSEAICAVSNVSRMALSRNTVAL